MQRNGLQRRGYLKRVYANRLSKQNAAQSAADALNFLAEAKKAGFVDNSSNCNAVFDNKDANAIQTMACL